MDDLDALLADAAEEVERAKKERRKAHVVTGAFVESDFRPVALIAMMNTVICQRCGSTEHLFEGLFEERAHRVRPTELHLVRLPTLPVQGTNLPRKRRFREHYVSYCSCCVDFDSYREQV
jgi:hypothetical protein